MEFQVKKKKGRKSKQTKLLELEEFERNKVPVKLFPMLNEKIFDLVEINGKEYFLDTDFSILYDEKIKQVGIKKNNEYIMYSEREILSLNEQVKADNDFVANIIKTI